MDPEGILGFIVLFLLLCGVGIIMGIIQATRADPAWWIPRELLFVALPICGFFVVRHLVKKARQDNENRRVAAEKRLQDEQRAEAFRIAEEQHRERTAPVPKDEVLRYVLDKLSAHLRSEPWLSLFSSVITEIAANEAIVAGHFERQAGAIASALEPLAKQIPQHQVASPIQAAFATFLSNTMETIQAIVHTILYNKYGDVPAEAHPGAWDHFLKPCLCTPYIVILNRVWKGEFIITNKTWHDEPYEDYKEDYLPVKGPHPECYLDGTPFERILGYPVPIQYTDQKRFEHTQIVGSTGAGKTTLLSHLILFDLKQPEPASVILIDPKRLVIDKLSRLKLDRDPLIISPRYEPAINLFAPSRNEIGAVETLCYLFSQFGTDLTGKMRTPFEYVAQLLLTFPRTMGRNATLFDFYDAMEDKLPERFRPAVQGLRPTQRHFFERANAGFENSEYRDTKRQIRSRLDRLLINPRIESLFTSQENKIDVFSEMQKGTLILVDTAIDLLGPENHKTFGCIFIALVMQAIYDRVALDASARRPTFLYIDEAQYFFNESVEFFLKEARQQKVGGVFAFHELADCTEKLSSSMMTQTATKLISRQVNVQDARAFAPYLRWEWEAIREQPEYHFACSISGVQDKAVSITAPENPYEGMDMMSEPEYRQLIERNRQRVGGQPQQQHQERQQQHWQEQPRRERRESRQEEPAPEMPEEPPHRWTHADDLAMADALHQLAVFMRRRDAKRVAELREHVADLQDRKKASDDYYGPYEPEQDDIEGDGGNEEDDEDDGPSTDMILRPGEPRRRRKRPKKRRGPTVGC